MAKNPRRLRQISVTVDTASEEAVYELLAGIFDTEPSVFENERTRLSTITVYLEDPTLWNGHRRRKLDEGLKRIEACGLDLGPGTVQALWLKRANWAESWKEHFHPLEISPRLLIRPSWTKCPTLPGRKVVVLDPGLSFGTGHHPTTRFCLEQLDAAREPGQPQSLLDIGTGTGILAISAAKLGYAPVTATDLDPDALRSATANAKRNRAAGNIRFRQEDLTRAPLTGRKHDLICANLMHDLLIAERKRILNRLKRSGKLVVAGILVEQYPRVRTALLESGCTEITTEVDDEWQSGTFSR